MSGLSFTPTEEQNEILNGFRLNKFTTIQALSGSGKTSSLFMLANSTDERILYLAFNKSMAEEARKKMPDNVECRTLHSICYQYLDVSLRHKLSRPEGAYVNVAGTGSEIAKKFKIGNLIDKRGKVLVAKAMIGLMIKQTLGKYEFSDDRHISRQHFPKAHIADLKRKGVNENKLITDVVTFAKQLWRERIDPESKTIMTHDTYVKLFELSGEDLGYDIIFGDEFQDVNPAFLSILRNAESAQKIVVVGDAYQSIYGWRGSENMMEQTAKYGIELPLSACFRFGPKVAQLANLILSDRGKMPYPLIGKGFDTEVGSFHSDIVDFNKPYTIIFRKNLTLLMEAMDRIGNGEDVAINVDTRDFVSMVDSVNALKRGDLDKVKHESVLPYGSWDEFVECAESDPDAKRLLNIVVSGKAGMIAHTLRTHKNSANASVTLTTAHKSKGLEWKQVIVANDFPSNFDQKSGEWIGLEEQERNLLYVAHTRCIERLQWNTTAQEIIDAAKAAAAVKHKPSTDGGLTLGNVRLGVFGAGYTRPEHIKQFIAAGLDGNDNHTQAYESWLDSEGEGGDFLGETRMMPDLARMQAELIGAGSDCYLLDLLNRKIDAEGLSMIDDDEEY